MLMKNHSIYILLLLTVSLLSTCKKEDPPTRLGINIMVQPQGGRYSTSVSVIFGGTITGTIKPVIVTVEWWWENGYHSEQQMVYTQDYIFDSGNPTSKNSICYAASGYYLLNYYWVKISWTDFDGPHTVESDKAFFGE